MTLSKKESQTRVTDFKALSFKTGSRVDLPMEEAEEGKSSSCAGEFIGHTITDLTLLPQMSQLPSNKRRKSRYL